MKKTITIGYIVEDKKPVTLDVKLKDGNLSICGNIPRHSSGQCQDEIDTMAKNGEIKITNSLWLILFGVWKEWHLNDMQAGCEHQRAEKWEEKRLDDSLPWTQPNSAMWTYKKDHPKGLLCEPCPVCGYKYGSAWLKKELPQDVVDFIEKL